MGLFGGKKKNEKTLSFGVGGYTFKSDEHFISYQSIYGKSFRVAKSDVESVSLDKGGMGKNKIKINGKGTLLAEIEMPKPWAEKVQTFITEEIQSSKGSSSPTSSIDDLEKLAELKDKGVITQEEFEQKKKQILGL
jgi:hypothetical protein